MGIEGSNGTSGAPHSCARLASSPPEAITTIRAPAAAAAVAALTVSSVLPENELAMTKVSGPTHPGHS